MLLPTIVPFLPFPPRRVPFLVGGICQPGMGFANFLEKERKYLNVILGTVFFFTESKLKLDDWRISVQPSAAIFHGGFSPSLSLTSVSVHP